MRVAIIHYWLVGMRGGERVLEALCEMFPEADVFTHVHVPGAVSSTIERHHIQTTFVSKLPRAARFYKSYLPFMPMALEQLDLRGYDLIISSESGPAKGVIPPAGALHLCYCHSPMRYVWNMLHDYQEGTSRFGRLLMSPLLHYVRFCDVAAATRVDAFAANSRTVAKRINSYWRRTADVIFPPVDVQSFKPKAEKELGDFHLMAGELVRYKRPDLAVEAFSRTGRRLVVIGGGEMLAELRAKAGPSVTLLGPQRFDVLKDHYARCKALIFPGEEDFGIVPVEAMASGRPVVAFGRGGATETVVDGVTGTFFEEQTIEALLDAVERCENAHFDPAAAVARSRVFGKDVFKASMAEFVQRSLAGVAA
ncbi:glycosyltransferase [Microvirga tunisiensis]|uniref:Glycosyltransferase family 4 protein n=1 Tax=Microvirga tunisiensis TaxID=2108360 RepID=A0A5N7MNX4_9HYPH|nr:glycosyltransferase [Microvirga tunisiensis]MPR10555.1 glycosyltransferase family 4 protein [Microvirga tunisiensis]MPR28712.1 glycosyltransferase family 4 protein [Microvirga tunisiensis]